ncbi:uncharacterized protein N7479_005102 [Penicillium vulpinum]|uniref:uncharacterized protein n=1 Tax=Penicillium vulpinum TaxID=29845 RepID=UPI002546B76B|nr:uncharacterized protein N7479_005102 [Penicillium vulpinum]KAJ5965226.1 hypothetical protein N7479_005102 [Penicillium vulpinum]
MDTSARTNGSLQAGVSGVADWYENTLNAGMCCLVHIYLIFREWAQQDLNIVVDGKGFGCGSSRE